MADPSRHADERNVLESLLRKIPGFKGYLEKEYRRESDQLARTLIAERLQKCKTSLDAHQKGLVNAGQLDQLSRCDSIRSRLNLLQSRVQGAMRGYSGFFDYVQVNETLLDQVYHHDLAIIDEAQGLMTVVEQLAASPAGADPKSAEQAFADVEKRLVGLTNQLDERTKMLEGLN